MNPRREDGFMRKRAAIFVATVIGTTTMLIGVAADPAAAHEERTVGKYAFAVGFGDEPAYAGQENSVQMFLHDATTDKPVTDLGPTLQVEVSTGNQTMAPMTMEPNFEVGEFGIPGDYRAFFFPTRPGSYTFHFTGAIGGQKVDVRFTSGTKTFSSVEDPAKVEFPAKDPTTGEIATRLDREFPRIDSALNDERESLENRIDTARLLGIIGLVVGALGLGAGVTGLIRRRG
jgi:hypothetical protein